jgi:hypothetical protein
MGVLTPATELATAAEDVPIGGDIVYCPITSPVGDTVRFMLTLSMGTPAAAATVAVTAPVAVESATKAAAFATSTVTKPVTSCGITEILAVWTPWKPALLIGTLVAAVVLASFVLAMAASTSTADELAGTSMEKVAVAVPASCLDVATELTTSAVYARLALESCNMIADVAEALAVSAMAAATVEEDVAAGATTVYDTLTSPDGRTLTESTITCSAGTPAMAATAPTTADCAMELSAKFTGSETARTMLPVTGPAVATVLAGSTVCSNPKPALLICAATADVASAVLSCVSVVATVDESVPEGTMTV